MEADMTNDKSLAIALNFGTILQLPAWSSGPRGTPDEMARTILAAGYEGVQGTEDPAYARAGLKTYAGGRVVRPEDADGLIAGSVARGHQATTLHVGTGFESDAQALGLIDAILKAAQKHSHPTHIETHRATITQDIWRTLSWIERFPEMTFNADLSHWYTGLEMTYGDVPAKLEILAPFFARVRFVHGRIGTSGIMQVAVENGGRDEPHLGHFKLMWKHCFAGYLASGASEPIVFAPELLPERVDAPAGPIYINYAVTQRDKDGNAVETSDRWEQGLKLVRIVKGCFEAAKG
jgi:hypothetical protein